MQTLIVTDDYENWSFLEEFAPIVSSATYLNDDDCYQNQTFKIINLCQSYHYQTIGYYVSLLAQARGHKAFPSVNNIQDVLNVGTKLISQDIHEEIQCSLHDIKTDKFVLSLYFGQNIAKRYITLARQLYDLFPLPLIRFYMEFKEEWCVTQICPLSISDIPHHHIEFMHQTAKAYFSQKKVYQSSKRQCFHDLAILVDKEEPNAPSNKKALDFFISSGEEIGLNVDIVDKSECQSIEEYDALFIRATTSVNHYTFRIARQASQENLIVIDDPQSIIKCTNKVYLAELLNTHHIMTPHTVFFNKYDKSLPEIDFPCVLKKPDSAFSLGVIKIEDKQTLKKSLNEFFETSDLILAQHFIPTEFDWRIGILNNKPLFACHYFMAPDHWQIYDWHSKEKQEGKTEAIPIEKVPESIIEMALKATKLIGNGLYGVDIKSKDNINYIIEINDNPNIDYGIEDTILGDHLYQEIMTYFLQRIRRKYGYV